MDPARRLDKDAEIMGSGTSSGKTTITQKQAYDQAYELYWRGQMYLGTTNSKGQYIQTGRPVGPLNVFFLGESGHQPTRGGIAAVEREMKEVESFAKSQIRRYRNDGRDKEADDAEKALKIAKETIKYFKKNL